MASAVSPEGLEEASREDPAEEEAGRRAASAKAPGQPQRRALMEQWIHSAGEAVRFFFPLPGKSREHVVK